MFLLIFESIGTSELILIGIVALIILGPRKLPEVARKLGKIMNELRSTTTEFKETWEREVNFDEEVKALQINELEKEFTAQTRPREGDGLVSADAPEIKEIDAARFEGLGASAADSDDDGTANPVSEAPDPAEQSEEQGSDALAKQNWL